MKAAEIRRPAEKTRVDVCIGKAGLHIGDLTYVRQGRRENSSFAYGEQWLGVTSAFAVSPDLPLIPGYQHRRPPTTADSVFHLALSDTEPDAWGRRVIARDHARQRRNSRDVAALTEMDYLLAVDDFSRVGALRLRDEQGRFLRTVDEGKRSTPPLVELQHMLESSRAVERGTESAEDLRYLLGKGTSLGGMRPKCTVIDEAGSLAIGKFPSINDTRSVTRGEVLALRMARRAGIDAAGARVVELDRTPVALITRFDRTSDFGRIPYMSAASMLQASREEEHSYEEIVAAIRTHGYQSTADLHQLWRRIVFNHLITNVDDHLQNHGFLHVEHGQWRLAPAFDINPFPDKDHESKTWLSELDGPVYDIGLLVTRSQHFDLSTRQALEILAEVCRVVADWRTIAQEPEIGMSRSDLEDFAPAFEHREFDAAIHLLRL